MRKALGVGLAVCGIAACALVTHQPQKLPDGSYRVACNASLTSCLEVFERVCDWHGYDVISASERRHHDDVWEVANTVIASEAVVRCKQPQPLFGAGAPRSPPAPPASPPPTPPLVQPSVPATAPAPATDGGVP